MAPKRPASADPCEKPAKRQRKDTSGATTDAAEPPAAAAAAPVAPEKVRSKTNKELGELPRDLVLKTWQRLVDGYTDDRSKSGYPAALRQSNGCLLAQKGANRQVSDRLLSFELASTIRS